MSKVDVKQLLDAGVHFGHLKRKWNPKMAPYIFMEKNGIHIIDLQKTAVKLEEACNAVKQIAKSGRKILFVATKKQAKDIVSERVKSVNMPYVTERWPGGLLTNFPTIRKTIKKMISIDKLIADENSFENMAKREKLQLTRQRAKLEKNFGSIADMNRLPSAIFVVDVLKEHISIKEAIILGIPIFGIVDTNSDPSIINFPIPANDDASKSISLIIDEMCKSIEEGLNERKSERDKEKDEEGTEQQKPKKTVATKIKSQKIDDISDDEVEEDVIDEVEEVEEVELTTIIQGDEEGVIPITKTKEKMVPAKVKRKRVDE